MPSEEIPSWDGDPASFEAFATSCKWFEYSLKDAEKKLAAPRVWQKLSGVAKSVVRHLEPMQGLQLRERHGEALGRASRKPTPEASDPGQLLKAGEVVEPGADLP